MNRFKRYRDKKKDYRNAYKRLKYKLDKKIISQKEFNILYSELKIKYSIK